MATGTRAIVAGWDTAQRRPKGVTSASDMRASLAMIADRPGIIYGERDAQITLSDTNMNLSFTGFNAAIPSRGGGWYTPRIADGSVTLQPGDSSFARVDVVWVRQHDYETDASHPDSEVEIGVTRGTPAASPAAPMIPSGALAVFTVTVPKGASRSGEIGLNGVVRAPWAYPVAPKKNPDANSTSRDITHLFQRVDTGGWILDGSWTARLEGKTVTLMLNLVGPWSAASSWRKLDLLRFDASLAPRYPNGDSGVASVVPTSSGGICYAWASGDGVVSLYVSAANTWRWNSVTLTWNIR